MLVFTSGRVTWCIIGVEVGSSLGLSGGCVDIKIGGYSVEFDRWVVGLPTLCKNAVAVVAARASALISGVR